MEVIVFFFSLCFINAYCSPADDEAANFSMKNVLSFLNLHFEHGINKKISFYYSKCLSLWEKEWWSSQNKADTPATTQHKETQQHEIRHAHHHTNRRPHRPHNRHFEPCTHKAINKPTTVKHQDSSATAIPSPTIYPAYIVTICTCQGAMRSQHLTIQSYTL